MTLKRVCSIVLTLLAVTAAATAEAQNLADVARRSGGKAARPPARVFTNADLPPVEEVPAAAVVPVAVEPVGSEPAAETVTESAAPEVEAGSPTEAIKPREKRPEEYWRARGRDLRDRLARATEDVSNTSSRLDALESGPASPTAEQERKVVAAALAKRLADLGYLQDEQNRLEARARAENIPVAWVR